MQKKRNTAWLNSDVNLLTVPQLCIATQIHSYQNKTKRNHKRFQLALALFR